MADNRVKKFYGKLKSIKLNLSANGQKYENPEDFERDSDSFREFLGSLHSNLKDAGIKCKNTTEACKQKDRDLYFLSIIYCLTKKSEINKYPFNKWDINSSFIIDIYKVFRFYVTGKCTWKWPYLKAPKLLKRGLGFGHKIRKKFKDYLPKIYKLRHSSDNYLRDIHIDIITKTDKCNKSNEYIGKLNNERHERYVDLVERRLQKAFNVSSFKGYNPSDLVERFTEVFEKALKLLDKTPEEVLEVLKLLTNKVKDGSKSDNDTIGELANDLYEAAENSQYKYKGTTLDNMKTIIKNFRL